MPKEPSGAFCATRMEKLARLESSGVSRKDISLAMGISESRISQLMDSEEYKEKESKVVFEKIRQTELVNKGWDSIEQLSITRVIKELQTNCDPEFALKAAGHANKATRRGSLSTTAIAQNTGMRAVIELNVNFIDKIKDNYTIKGRKLGNSDKDNNDSIDDNQNQITSGSTNNLLLNLNKKKVTNHLSASGVQKLLTPKLVEAKDRVKEIMSISKEITD